MNKEAKPDSPVSQNICEMERTFCQTSLAARGSEDGKLIRVAITVFAEPTRNFRRLRGQDQPSDFCAYSTMIEHLICGMIENDVRL
jgi:hypothetical protein